MSTRKGKSKSRKDGEEGGEAAGTFLLGST